LCRRRGAGRRRISAGESHEIGDAGARGDPALLFRQGKTEMSTMGAPPSLPPAARRGPSSGPSPSELALQSATAAMQAGRPAEAEQLAAEVLKSNAGNLAAMQLLGTALLMQGRGKDAIAPLE